MGRSLQHNADIAFPGDLPGIEQHAAAIHALAGEKRVIDSPVAVVKVGLALQAVRNVLGPSRFQDWLADEFHWGQPAASNWMRAAARFGHLEEPCLAQFRHTALYELARRNVPPAAREEAIDCARKGTEITLPVAEEIIRRHLGIPVTVSQIARSCDWLKMALAKISPDIAALAHRDSQQLQRGLAALSDEIQQLRDRFAAISSAPEGGDWTEAFDSTSNSKPDAACRHLNAVEA